MSARACLLVLTLASASSCTSPRTEVILSVDTDLRVPAEVDSVRVTLTQASGRERTSVADLTVGAPLPRTLGLVHEGGSLGPHRVEVEGLSGGTVVVTRAARFSFIEEETRALLMVLRSSCVGVRCGTNHTCEEGACRAEDVTASELLSWSGTAPGLDAGGTGDGDARQDGDAWTDADAGDGDARPDGDGCLPTAETCNSADDDCDGVIDDGFDLEIDPLHCGGCGQACSFRHGDGECAAGECVVTSCDPNYGDCNDDGRDGCETDLRSTNEHCGWCGNACNHPPDRCCASECRSPSSC